MTVIKQTNFRKEVTDMRKLFFGISLALVLALTLFPGFAPNASADPKGQADHANLIVADLDTAVYCGVEAKKAEPWILHIAASADSSKGTLTIEFKDDDIRSFNVPADGSFSMTQALGGVPGTDDVVRISVGGGTTNAMASAQAMPGAKDPFDEQQGKNNEKDNFCITVGPGQAGVKLTAGAGTFPNTGGILE